MPSPLQLLSAFSNSKHWTNINTFSKYNIQLDTTQWIQTKDPIDLLIPFIIYTILKPKSFLEIGVYEGLMLANALDAQSSIALTGIDIEHRLQKFNKLYNNPSMNFKGCDSNSVKFHLSEKFDIVHIDGDHSYEHAKNDILKLDGHLTNTSIVIIDDYNWPDVKKAAIEATQQIKLHPVLITSRCSYWTVNESVIFDVVESTIFDISKKYLLGSTSNIRINDHNTHYLQIPQMLSDIGVFTSVLKYWINAQK